MNAETFDVGAFVQGAPTAPRLLVSHAGLFDAYSDGSIGDGADAAIAADGEAYLSHFVFGMEMRRHYRANRNSVAGYAGPCWCRWLVLDIDRAGDIPAALADARALARVIARLYPETAGEVPVYFSGSKGFHVLLDLSHRPPPAAGFQATARTLAEMLAGQAGARIDTGLYDVNRLVRLPNTRHPKTGRYKRLLSTDELFNLTADGIAALAAGPCEELPLGFGPIGGELRRRPAPRPGGTSPRRPTAAPPAT